MGVVGSVAMIDDEWLTIVNDLDVGGWASSFGSIGSVMVHLKWVELNRYAVGEGAVRFERQGDVSTETALSAGSTL